MKAEFNYPIEFYAARCGVAADRLHSASGGVVSALGRYVLEHGGTVFGVRWNEDFRAVFDSADTLEGLESFRGSKYVQSVILPETYEQIATLVRSGRLVMVAALPCQIAGILARLDAPADNLLTVDLICHGVPPESAFKSELARYKRFVRRADDIRFRGNDAHDYHLSFWSGGKCLYSRRAYTQPYFGAYLASVNLKEACYSCPFARPERISDFTAGDYIVQGAGGESSLSEGKLSALCVSTPKAAELLRLVQADQSDIHLEPRPYEERLGYGPSLRHPSTPGRERGCYTRLLRIFSPATAVRLALWRRWISVSVVRAKSLFRR